MCVYVHIEIYRGRGQNLGSDKCHCRTEEKNWECWVGQVGVGRSWVRQKKVGEGGMGVGVGSGAVHAAGPVVCSNSWVRRTRTGGKAELTISR